MDSETRVAAKTQTPEDVAALLSSIGARAEARAVFAEWEGTSLSYAELLGDIQGFCGVFDSLGLLPGANVLIVTANERRAIGAFVAALADGLVPVLLTPETPAPRAEAIAARLSPGLVLIDAPRLESETWSRAHPVLTVDPDLPSKSLLRRLRAGGEGGGSLEGALAASRGRFPRCTARVDDLAYILFTSGTTSAPKGVMITHRNLFTHLATLARAFHYTPDSALFNGMVLAHGDGLVQGPLLALACGCRLVRPPAFSAQSLERHLDMVRARRATHFLSVPSVYAFIDRYAAHDDYFAAPEFEALISVAAKLETPLWQRLERRFARPVFNMYGLTETVASALYAGPAPEMGPVGTIGRPIDVTARIMFPDGAEAETGEIGEIWLAGENVSPGYYRAPEATGERYCEGWLKTGDLGFRRPDGAFEIVGRLKTAIMCGGFLIQPEEVDEALLRHPAVAEVATVGIPDEDFGEIPVAAVICDRTCDEADLTAHCARNVEPRKIPKRIVAVQEIPRGDAGKPSITAVRDMLARELRAGSPATPDANVEAAVLAAAARVFRVPDGSLSLAATPETVERWDSFAHVSLVTAVEASLGIRLPTREVIAVASLGELAAAASRQKANS